MTIPNGSKYCRDFPCFANGGIREFVCRTIVLNVRFWPKADMGLCGAHVRFRG